MVAVLVWLFSHPTRNGTKSIVATTKWLRQKVRVERKHKFSFKVPFVVNSQSIFCVSCENFGNYLRLSSKLSKL